VLPQVFVADSSTCPHTYAHAHQHTHTHTHAYIYTLKHEHEHGQTDRHTEYQYLQYDIFLHLRMYGIDVVDLYTMHT